MWTLRRILAALVLVSASAVLPSCYCAAPPIELAEIVVVPEGAVRAWSSDRAPTAFTHKVVAQGRWVECHQEIVLEDGAVVFNHLADHHVEELIIAVDGMGLHHHRKVDGSRAEFPPTSLPLRDFLEGWLSAPPYTPSNREYSFVDVVPLSSREKGMPRYRIDLREHFDAMEPIEVIAKRHGLRPRALRTSLED